MYTSISPTDDRYVQNKNDKAHLTFSLAGFQNNHDTVQQDRRKWVRTKHNMTPFAYLFVVLNTQWPIVHKIESCSMHGEEIRGYTGVTNTDARKENEGNRKIIVNTYSRKTPHRKQPCDATTVPVKNPYKKLCLQCKMDAPLQQWIVTNTRVSKRDFILPLPHITVRNLFLIFSGNSSCDFTGQQLERNSLCDRGIHLWMFSIQI